MAMVQQNFRDTVRKSMNNGTVPGNGSGQTQAVAIPSVAAKMAAQYGMESKRFVETLKATVIKGGSNEELAAFCMVASAYQLNPFTREIYAFPKRGGGIQPIVSVDGWAKLVNSRPEFDGVEFDECFDSGKLVAVTCRIYRKDRSHAVAITEYLAECRQNSDTWNKWPVRMLRHKAFIQAARMAFSFSGIIDPDEADRYVAVGACEASEHPEPVISLPVPQPQPEEAPMSEEEAERYALQHEGN